MALGKLFLTSMSLLIGTMRANEQPCSKYETYNVGLTSAVTEDRSRVAQIIDELESTDSDVVCLQEVWMEKDMSYILDKLKSKFPHHYSAIHAGGDLLRKPVAKPSGFWGFIKSKAKNLIKDTACSVGDSAQLTTTLVPCALVKGCLSKKGYQLGECVVQKCASVMKKMDKDCMTCFFLNAFHGLKTAANVCSLKGKKHNRVNAPGLLVLSKSRMSAAKYVSYFPGKAQVFQRGYIQATLENKQTFACTHLSANLSGYMEHDLGFDSYYKQQKSEIKNLVKTFSDQDVVLLGDLNTGPEIVGSFNEEKNLAGEFTKNYDLLLDHDFISTYAVNNGRCTYCYDNPLTYGYPNQILDHVMIKGPLSAISTKRLYDGYKPPLSDHYGVQVEVCMTDKSVVI